MSTLTLTRTVAAGPERAWQAWTDPAELAAWWWPQWPDTTYDLDVRVGGRYRIHSAGAAFGISGEYTRVDRPHLLAMTWVWHNAETSPDAAPDEVEIEFTAEGEQTVVTVRHTSAEELQGSGTEQGWNAVLDRFAGR